MPAEVEGMRLVPSARKLHLGFSTPFGYIISAFCSTQVGEGLRRFVFA